MQNSQFYEYLRELIASGRRSYEDLVALEEDRLIALYILEDQDRFAFLASSEKYNELIAEILETMQGMEFDLAIASEIYCQITDIANDRFKGEIAQIFEQEVTSREHTINEERGLKKSYDEHTGEVRWHK